MRIRRKIEITTETEELLIVSRRQQIIDQAKAGKEARVVAHGLDSLADQELDSNTCETQGNKENR